MLEILQSVSVIIASLTAIFGIYSWRNEHVGKQKIDLSEEVLSRMYELKEIIKFIRSCIGYAGEGSSREQNKTHSKEDNEILDTAYVIVERYTKYAEKFNEFYAMKYRYMAKFGKESTKPFNIIKEVINEIMHASSQLGRLWQQERLSVNGTYDDKKLQEKIEKYEAIFWDTDENHELNKKIDSAIEYCEMICKEVNEAKIYLFRKKKT